MIKLINYKCKNCDYEQEEYFFEDEIHNILLVNCPKCGDKLEKFNFKNNKQVWSFVDKRN